MACLDGLVGLFGSAGWVVSFWGEGWLFGWLGSVVLGGRFFLALEWHFFFLFLDGSMVSLLVGWCGFVWWYCVFCRFGLIIDLLVCWLVVWLVVLIGRFGRLLWLTWSF